MKAVAFVILATCAAFCCSSARSQSFPSRPVHIIVPYPPGGTTDIVARVVAQKLSTVWGQAVVIDNRPGAGGNLGIAFVARAPADGYTLLLSGVSFAINPSLYETIPYHVIRDFAPITEVASTPEVLEVNPSLPVNSVDELIALAKSRPGQLFYGSAGYGTTLHLSAALFSSMAGIEMTHVPFKGASEAVVDLVAGRIQVVIDSLPSSFSLIKAGKLKALATTSAKRAVALPELPTVSEAGVLGYEATSWYGAYAPANTPQDIRKKLETDFMSVIQMPDVRQKLLAQGAEPIGGTSEQFAKLVKDEVSKWSVVVKSVGANVK